ncbi:hypothetical protein V8F06_011519 [Rhypophila decipiens]
MSNSDSTDDNGNAYEWLADLSKRQCFTTCSVTHPAKTLDFGDEGFTASVTDRHELVQLTRPDATCGLVYLRGPFPDNPGSILSRSQSRDDTVDFTNDTFGTTILAPKEPDEVTLGERKAQGWVNFRWPYSQYELVKKDPSTGEIEGMGTCEVLSFVSRGTVFQINRLKWGHGSSVTNSEETGERPPETSGPRPGTSVISSDDPAETYGRVRVGGKVRFGCPCSNNNPRTTTPERDMFTIRHRDRNGLHCTSDKYGARLEIGVSENGVPWDFKRDDGARVLNDEAYKRQCADLSCELRVRLLNGEATYLVSTYALRTDKEDEVRNCSLELPPDLESYLGVEWESENMTDRLWTALCSTNYEAAEAVEFCVVGRCVEQILGVTSIPVRQHSSDSGPPQRALINNLMTNQIVDVESAFYQIRLLTKIYNFIQTRKLEPDLLDPILSLETIRTTYLKRMHPIIRACVCWLFATNLKPDRLLLAVHSRSTSADNRDREGLTETETKRIVDCSDKRLSLSWDHSYNRGCYATMAAWYAFKLCPEAIDTPDDHSFVSQIVLPNLPVAFEFGKSRANRDKQPTPKGNVLGWLHFSVILMLYNDLAWEENESPTPTDVNREDFNRRSILEAQQLFEKYVSRLKTSQGDGWSMEHEELDRVVLLAEEMAVHLDFERFDSLRRSHSLAVSRARHTRRRIQNRKRTTKFNPGPKPWMAVRGLSKGPWELLCTNHESYLRVADYGNVIPARDWVMEFLLSDYSFMSSWDRADANMVGRWWDIQPVAIVCSTLIDLRLEGKLPSAASLSPPAGDTVSAQDQLAQSIPNLQAAPTMNFDAAELINPGAGSVPDPSAAQVAMLRVLVQQLKQSIEDSGKAQAYEIRQLIATSLATAGGDGIVGLATGKPFEWIYRQPAAVYYPEWWVKSTADNAGIYLDDLDLLDVIDVSQTNLFTFEASWKRTKALPLIMGHPEESHLARLTSITGRSRTAATTPLAVTPVPAMGREPSRPVTDLGGPKVNIVTSEDFLKTLGQSLLDLGLKHRLFFVQRFSPSLKDSLPRWHPDAAMSIRDHFGASSRFTESRETSIWTTSITISHWTMRTKTEYKADPYREPGRQNGDFPPEDIAHLSKTPVLSFGSPYPRPIALSTSMSMEHIVEEQSTTLVLTGDNQGYMWMCSILSPTVDSKSVARAVCDDGKGIPRLLRKFIHQQGSARCLVFLLLLGHVCEKLASGYNLLLKRLDDIMEIGDRTLIDGVDSWINADESINKLKKMLWGWEALRVFNDKLSSSLFQIQRAQEAMEHIIKQDAAQQHVDLIQEYNSVMDEFKRRYGMLADVHDKTQLKIKQVTGLRDGISTITNVVDTQTALSYNITTIQQGNNIRTLTYITIAYLPLGLVCALYSLEEGTFMKGASDQMFGALIVGCSLGTYLLAYVLDKMLVKFESIAWVPKGLRFRMKRQKRLGVGGATRAGGGGGEDYVDDHRVHGAVIEMGDVARRSAESPGKGWLSGATAVREIGESGGGLRGGRGREPAGTGIFRRTSGSVLV